MSLNPNDDILTQIIKSYEGYADMLSGQDRKDLRNAQALLQVRGGHQRQGRAVPRGGSDNDPSFQAAPHYQGTKAGYTAAQEQR
jgi:hypothetical protein